jgi:hypothetical protein
VADVNREQPVEAFPLCWPLHRKRTSYRERGRFKTSFAKARDNIIAEVSRMGGRNAIISTNIELRRDGLPYASFTQPSDPGVALYFTYKNKPMCFACDRYRNAQDNMHAISLTISALRGVARWGTGDMMEAAFTGFIALPAPAPEDEPYQILGVDRGAAPNEIEYAYKRLAAQHHPDKGGSNEQMARINAARDAMLGAA